MIPSKSTHLKLWDYRWDKTPPCLTTLAQEVQDFLLEDPEKNLARIHLKYRFQQPPDWSSSWWNVVPGPSAYYYCSTLKKAETFHLKPLYEQQQKILQLYKRCIHLDPMDSQERLNIGQQFVTELKGHLLFKENLLWPVWREGTQEERVLRELGYEHQGLHKGLKTFMDFVHQIVQEKVSKREKDHYDIEFFHLFEHHMEREQEGFYPCLEWLLLEPLPNLQQNF